MPQVVGALVAGLILGPSILNVVGETVFIRQTAEIGVIVILFLAGLETDLKEIKQSGKASLIIAMFGVFVPLIMGFGIAYIFEPGFDHATLFKNIFIGVIITATSVSISVETLRELGKINTKVGNSIITAALIDDVLGIILLTVITGFSKSGDSSSVGVSILIVTGKIVAFFIFALLIGVIFNRLFEKYSKGLNEKRRFPIISLAFCLIMAYIAEHFFGVADITGAFIAGVVISNTNHVKYIGRRINTLSYLFLSPIFFAHVGISTNLRMINTRMLVFALSLFAVAIISKVLGCGFGAYTNGFSTQNSLKIGMGMSARSEVALIIASNGVAYGILGADFYPAVILLVVISSIVTPILLKISYSRQT
jgi:Kef-type K+ transport system membrane component KefB